MYVFIDESGDPGFKIGRGSSSVFVAALVAFPDKDGVQAVCASLDGLAAKLRLKSEFKFNKSRPEVKDEFFSTVIPLNFFVRAIVVQKDLIYSPNLRADKERFYSFFVNSMLKFDNGLLQNARIIIDGSGDREYRQELSGYLRRNAVAGAIKSVKFGNSANDRAIQLADMCAGAIARSFRTDRDDAKRWRTMLQPKIQDVWNFR